MRKLCMLEGMDPPTNLKGVAAAGQLNACGGRGKHVVCLAPTRTSKA